MVKTVTEARVVDFEKRRYPSKHYVSAETVAVYDIYSILHTK